MSGLSDERKSLGSLLFGQTMGVFETGRYERKYVVTETVAGAIRQFVAAYMLPDPYMSPAEPRGYQIHSLYLDTPQLALYRLTTDGIKNRYKLRLRLYDTSENAPVFLEIKRRASNTLYKQRAAVRKQVAEKLLWRERLGTADLLSPDEKSIRALAEFCERQAQLGADAAVFVSYWREAYVLPHAEGARITFDRQVVGHPYNPSAGLAIPEQSAVVTSSRVVLELKYIGRAPWWMKDLIRSFGLERISFPKYVRCIDALRLAPGLGNAAANVHREYDHELV